MTQTPQMIGPYIHNKRIPLVAHLQCCNGSFRIMHPKLPCTLLFRKRACLQACCVSIHFSRQCTGCTWCGIGARIAMARVRAHNLIHLPPTRHHYSSSMYHHHCNRYRGTLLCVCRACPPAASDAAAVDHFNYIKALMSCARLYRWTYDSF